MVLALVLADAVLGVLRPEVPLSRAVTYTVPALGPGEAFCIAETSARPRETIPTRGFHAPACLPAGYGVPARQTLVLHLKDDGSCTALRLDGPWQRPDALTGVHCVDADGARARGGALVRGAGSVWHWAER